MTHQMPAPIPSLPAGFPPSDIGLIVLKPMPMPSRLNSSCPTSAMSVPTKIAPHENTTLGRAIGDDRGRVNVDSGVGGSDVSVHNCR